MTDGGEIRGAIPDEMHQYCAPVAQWPDGERGLCAFYLAPPTPVVPREGIAHAWKEGVELHGTAFVVLHGRSSSDPAALRRYAAAVLAAALLIERGGRDEQGAG